MVHAPEERCRICRKKFVPEELLHGNCITCWRQEWFNGTEALNREREVTDALVSLVEMLKDEKQRERY